MTRKELLNSPFNWFSKNEVLYIIDELESRTCENCKWLTIKSLKYSDFLYCSKMAEFLDDPKDWEDITYLEVKKTDSCTIN